MSTKCILCESSDICKTINLIPIRLNRKDRTVRKYLCRDCGNQWEVLEEEG